MHTLFGLCQVHNTLDLMDVFDRTCLSIGPLRHKIVKSFDPGKMAVELLLPTFLVLIFATVVSRGFKVNDMTSGPGEACGGPVYVELTVGLYNAVFLQLDIGAGPLLPEASHALVHYGMEQLRPGGDLLKLFLHLASPLNGAFELTTHLYGRCADERFTLYLVYNIVIRLLLPGGWRILPPIQRVQ